MGFDRSPYSDTQNYLHYAQQLVFDRTFSKKFVGCRGNALTRLGFIFDLCEYLSGLL